MASIARSRNRASRPFGCRRRRGYHLEARIPLSFVGPRLWIEARRRPRQGKAGVRAADAPRRRPAVLHDRRARRAARDLHPRRHPRHRHRRQCAEARQRRHAGLETRRRDGRAERHPGIGDFMTVDTSQLAAAVHGARPARAARASAPRSPGSRMRNGCAAAGSQELLLDRRGADRDRRPNCAAPWFSSRPAISCLALRDRALTRLFNLTLLATARRGHRHVRLSPPGSACASGGCATPPIPPWAATARIRLDMPESASADEIGALSRGFERLLARLNEHTQYLRTLGGKLSHELRTPLTIVRSSLDNLESEGVRDDQRRYVTRAREGTQRLQSILSALGRRGAGRGEHQASRTREFRSAGTAVVGRGRLSRRLSAGTHSSSKRRPMPASCAARPISSCSCSTSSSKMPSISARPAGTITVRLDARCRQLSCCKCSNDGPPIPASAAWAACSSRCSSSARAATTSRTSA